jgi:hypothetical protein
LRVLVGLRAVGIREGRIDEGNRRIEHARDGGGMLAGRLRQLARRPPPRRIAPQHGGDQREDGAGRGAPGSRYASFKTHGAAVPRFCALNPVSRNIGQVIADHLRVRCLPRHLKNIYTRGSTIILVLVCWF